MLQAQPVETLADYLGENVILNGISESEYFSLEAASFSGMKNMRKGPGYFRYYHDNPSEDEETKARHEGKLFHLAIGEPERFEKQVVAIDGNRNANAVKEQIAYAESLGKVVTKTPIRDQILRVRDYVRNHEDVRPLLAAGRAEQVLLWKDPETGVQCKGRVDWLTPGWVMADWKTFSDLSDYAIEKQMRRMHYHWQSGFYTEGGSIVSGRNLKMFANVFIRVEDPIDCRVIILPDTDIEEARSHYRPYLKLYAECIRTGQWPMRMTQGPTVLPLRPYFD